MATIYDIAQKLGLSAATVSRVLNGVNHPVSDKTKQRILETAKEMDYRPNTIAKSLSKGSSQTIAILLPSIMNDFYTQFVDIIENHVSQTGYSTILCNTHRDIARETNFIDTLLERRVDGVVFCPTRMQAEDNEKNLQNVQKLKRNNVPVVAIGSHFGAVSQVYVDTFEGTRMATEYLLSLGHRVIGFIDGLPAGTSRRRFRGYAETLKAHDVSLREEWVRHGDLSYESGVRCAKELLLTVKPTALIAVNNSMAVGALNAAREQGVDVPGELSIIGFDDSPVSRFVYPQLTVVRQPLDQIGESVRMLLANLIENKDYRETVKLLPEIVLRDSCTKAPDSREG